MRRTGRKGPSASGYVTALAAEAASFSGRIGLTRAQPGSGVDVERAVAVGVHAAVHRADNGVLLRAGASSPAAVAVDARVSRVHEHDSPLSFFRFSCEDARELCPARIKDRTVQAALGGGVVREEPAR